MAGKLEAIRAGTAAGVRDALTRARGAGRQPAGFETRASQSLAAFLLPFVFIIGMAIGATIFQAFTQILVSLRVPDTLVGVLSFLLGVGLVAGNFIGCWFWVRTGGYGLFSFR